MTFLLAAVFRKQNGYFGRTKKIGGVERLPDDVPSKALYYLIKSVSRKSTSLKVSYCSISKKKKLTLRKSLHNFFKSHTKNIKLSRYRNS